MKNPSSYILKKLVFILTLIVFSVLQSPAQQDYFQQEVNTVIRVSLDDQTHSLSGNIFIEYTNNSNLALDTIYLHLWANAFQSKSSAFTKQKLRHKDSNFYFTDEKNMGGYDSLQFKIEGVPAKWAFHPKYNDVAYILLEKSLKPEESTTISSGFKLKIPGQFSRLGYEKNPKKDLDPFQSYQITQWFPKPAVFDASGWHPMPYLDMGEFYSEFGDYDVTITLPENYMVAATGELLTTSELERIQKRIEYTDDFLTSNRKEIEGISASGKKKTIRFIAENVHDFAWFANKSFLIKEGKITIDQGESIKSQVFFLPDERNTWKQSLEYLERGTRFYIDKVGPYPYSKVAVVQGPLLAGGGMEYPMITIISEGSGGKSLDQVITHEIGHNWFYGILAFNEREYPWMDEGINSYYDHRYSKHNYPPKESKFWAPRVIRTALDSKLEHIYHEFAHSKALAQPSDLHSNEFTLTNYFLGAYENPARAFTYLEKYLGTALFDSVMQSFYKKWALKHPGPNDLISHFERETGKDLSWFFEGMIGDTRSFDYGIKSVSQKGDSLLLEIENHTNYPIPFTLTSISNDTMQSTQFIEGFVGIKTLKISGDGVQVFSVDEFSLYPDVNRNNNRIRTRGVFKKTAPIRFGIMDIIEKPEITQIGWLPSFGWNKSDGWMIGLMLFNHSLPNKSFQYMIHPGNVFSASILNKPYVGQARFSYDWYKNRTVRNIRASLGLRSFHLEYQPEKQLRYFKVQPSIEVIFNKFLYNQNYYVLKFTNDWIGQETFTSESLQEFKYGYFNRLSIERKDSKIMNPLNGKIELETGNFNHFLDNRESYVNLKAELSSYFRFAKQKKLDVRIYAAGQLWNSGPKNDITRPGTLGLIGFANNDYMFDDYFLDRGAQKGQFSKQINMSGGGFKNSVRPATELGQSNQFVVALNLKTDLPINVPVLNSIKPYFDFGMYRYSSFAEGSDYENKYLYSGGLVFSTFEDVLNLYIPLINSKSINEIYAEEPGFIQRISFSMKLNLFDFSKLLNRDDLIFMQ
jgi:hypothetical protein